MIKNSNRTVGYIMYCGVTQSKTEAIIMSNNLCGKFAYLHTYTHMQKTKYKGQQLYQIINNNIPSYNG